jgi:hypothetical protein
MTTTAGRRLAAILAAVLAALDQLLSLVERAASIL